MDVIVEIFDKYGWGGIIGLIICLAIFFGGKWLSKKLEDDMSSGLEKVGEKLTDQMSKQNDQLINTIIGQQDKLLDHLLDKQKKADIRHGDMMIDKIKLADEINQSLKEIMLTHNSQRAFIIEFHNTSSNLSGIPFAKYSCTYEWFDKGLMPLAAKCNSLPFSQMATITNEVLAEPSQIKIYDDMSKMADNNPSLFASVKDTKTKSIVYSAMFDKNNILIGMLVLEYQKEHTITQEELNQLGVETVQLTSIINIRYKYSE